MYKINSMTSKTLCIFIYSISLFVCTLCSSKLHLDCSISDNDFWFTHNQTRPPTWEEKHVHKSTVNFTNSAGFIIIYDGDVSPMYVSCFNKVNCDLSKMNLSNITAEKLYTECYQGRTLNLSHNYISEFSNDVFSGVTYMHELYLHHNRLEVVSVELFKDFMHLKWLDLSYNFITILDPVLTNRINYLVLVGNTNLGIGRLGFFRKNKDKCFNLIIDRTSCQLTYKHVFDKCKNIASVICSSSDQISITPDLKSMYGYN